MTKTTQESPKMRYEPDSSELRHSVKANQASPILPNSLITKLEAQGFDWQALDEAAQRRFLVTFERQNEAALSAHEQYADAHERYRRDLADAQKRLSEQLQNAQVDFWRAIEDERLEASDA